MGSGARYVEAYPVEPDSPSYRFMGFKTTFEKAGVIEKKTGSELVGMIGHIAIFYRQHKDAEKRTVHVPKR
jgi:hypothetical protein